MNRARALRLSLLVSIGAVPACGGNVVSSHNGDGNAGQGGSGNKTPGGTKRPPSIPGSSTGGTGIVMGTAGSLSIGGSFGTAGGEGQPTTSCTTPRYDAHTGLVSCDEGYQYRPQAVVCGAALGGAGPSEEPNLSGCSTDAECDPGSICLCDEPESPTGGACRPANCATDSDCADGYRCASYNNGCWTGFACQAPGDECLGDNPTCGPCAWDEFTGKRTCGARCDVGRPFLVEDEARVAPVTSRGDWFAHTANAPCVDHLTKSERATLAQHWTKMGQMEHASIAAFARFQLQLLALGAPPELVEACTSALADETAHTKLCFGIASAYAGHAIGPGALDVSRSLEVTSVADIVDLVIAEGCFGETGATLEALEAADSAADPVIVAAYSQIAADEARHAELAFRFVRWALERGGDSVAQRVTAAITEPPALSAAALGVAIPCLHALLRPLASTAAHGPASALGSSREVFCDG